jgi:hypothetical protein
MKHTYTAIFQIDVGDAIRSVGELLRELNDTLSMCGHDGELRAVTDIFSMSVTADRELTEKEQYEMKRILEAEVIRTFPEYDIRLKAFSGKPGNVQQSAA